MATWNWFIQPDPNGSVYVDSPTYTVPTPPVSGTIDWYLDQPNRQPGASPRLPSLIQCHYKAPSDNSNRMVVLWPTDNSQAVPPRFEAGTTFFFRAYVGTSVQATLFAEA